jgi:hypothetical protein
MNAISFSLPSDAVAFLRAGRQLEYDFAAAVPGEVKLRVFDELELGEAWISTIIKSDPHFEEFGYYAVPAISLTEDCEEDDSEYILLWLPHERLFGTWDSDRWLLTVFEHSTWTDIVENPITYINAQWYPDSQTSKHFIPWPKYAFKKGRPSMLPTSRLRKCRK